ncbi:MAG: NlpC/P60 family protein [Beijerinckiaceae bacterium]
MSGDKTFDPRLTPARPGLAAAHLRGQVEAAHFVEGRHERVVAGIADLRGEPSPGAGVTTQTLRGESVNVYEIEEGWAWVQLDADGYVGYMPAAALAPEGQPATHRVAVLSTFLYPGPSMKMPVSLILPLNARLAVTGIEGDFARIEDEGFVWAAHLTGLNEHEPDFVAVAERFIGVPYLWGGKSAHGIDCSGLVQISLAAAGIAAPRDTDMQQAALGTALAEGETADAPWLRDLRRGDLIFWRGHVGIMRDVQTLLHANGHHMLVASEPLVQALERIRGKSYGEVTSVRRIRFRSGA